jgi:hypothetical protein
MHRDQHRKPQKKFDRLFCEFRFARLTTPIKVPWVPTNFGKADGEIPLICSFVLQRYGL